MANPNRFFSVVVFKSSELIFLPWICLFLLVSCQTTSVGRLKTNGSDHVRFYGKINIIGISRNVSRYNKVIEVKDDGTFSLSNDLPKGKYLIEVVAPGFHIASQRLILPTEKQIVIELKELTKTTISGFKTKSTQPKIMGEGAVKLNPPQL